MDSLDLEAQIAAARGTLAFLEGLREVPTPTRSPEPPRSGSADALKRLLHSPKWPLAIEPRHLCDQNSDGAKILRGRGVLENLIDRHITHRDSLLDFGCGEGHTAWAMQEWSPRGVVGYDPVPQGWCRYPERPDFLLSSDWEQVKERAPYELILAYDVLDHSLAEEPEAALARMREVLAPGGYIYLRLHPWTSRHGGHGYHRLNRAFCHLLFPEASLRAWGWDGLPTRRILDPLPTYRAWMADSGMRVVTERPQAQDVERFFSGIPQVARRCAGLEETMRVAFLDLVLERP